MANLFREKALAAYLDPESRGGLVRATPPHARSLVLGLVAVFTLAAAASAVVRVPITTRGAGVVRPSIGLVTVRAATRGRVRRVEVVPGQRVIAGSMLADIDGPIVAPVAGVVDIVRARVNDVIEADGAVLRILPEGAELVAFLAVPARDAAHVHRDQDVRLGFDAFPQSEYGFGRGHVADVSRDVADPDLVDWALPPASAGEEPRFLVTVRVDAMPRGVSAPLTSGMTFEGIVDMREQRLIVLLFSPLRELLGE
ncbi:MAG: HlyD family efflux transporter periplasmic adaptor subunit [Sandaracinus sp.]